MILWLYLFLIIFINGFEAGGYQASIYSIKQTYDLSITEMGLFASVELFATMLAPLLLGSWADRTKKTKCLLILLGIQIVFSLTIFLSNISAIFIACIFFLGLTTSALQFIAIATLAESYPASGKKKIGFMTSMYALGALLAPLFVDFYLSRGVSWRMIFLMLTVGSVIAFAGVFACRNRNFENAIGQVDEINEGNEGFVIAGVLLLCVVMCIYVGFENGFAYFVDALFIKELNSPYGNYALSIFWAVMIPSRVLVGIFSKHARKILIAAVITIPVVTTIISMMSEGSIVMALCIPLGFASGAIYPSVLTTLMRFSGDKKATATAMITTATGIGGAAFTALSGVLAGIYENHLSGNFAIRATMVTLAAFFLLSIEAVLALKKIGKVKEAK